jgi:hypothetical protein
MHLVALTRWNTNANLLEELPPFAAALGIGAYDVRMKLASPAPSVLASALPAAAAQRLLELLHSRGHGAITVAVDTLLAPGLMLQARSVSVSERALAGLDTQGQPFSLPFTEISATLRASEQSDLSETVATQGKKLALGRAILSGGLLRNKTVTKLETTESSDRQPIAYIFQGDQRPPLVLKERCLNYEGLGVHRGLTAHESFEKLLSHLRAQVPGSLHDDRLLTQKRKLELTSVKGVGPERVISNSNEGANALAAQLIVLAHRLRQL